MSKKSDFFTSLGAYLGIFGVGLLGWRVLPPGGGQWGGSALLAVFALLFSLSPGTPQTAWWKTHGYLGAQTLVAGSLLLLATESWNIFPVLFFILSAQAVTLISQRAAYTWIGVFGLITGVAGVLNSGWPEGAMNWLAFAAGYVFFGAFSYAWMEADAARQESQRLLTALEIAHAQLRDYAARVEMMTLTAERARLAREMHDTLGHTLTALDVQLELMCRLPEAHSAARQQAAEQARGLVKQGLSEARRAVQALRPSALEHLSLPEAVAGLAHQFQELHTVPVTWRVEGDARPLPPALIAPLYRAAQEALTNVRRHAPDTTAVFMTLQYTPQEVSLRIENDAPPAPAVENGGQGLPGLRERAATLGGAFHAGPRAAGGFVVEMRLPLGEMPVLRSDAGADSP